MGFWGIVFACAFLPTAALCMASKRYLPVGVIMTLNWIAYTIPFREFVGAPDETIYFVFVTTATAIALSFVNLVVAHAIIGLIAILLTFVYFPLSIGYITTDESMVLADVIEYMQILAMLGGAGGHFIRRHFTTRNSTGRPYPVLYRQNLYRQSHKSD